MRLATRAGCLATSRINGALHTTTTSFHDAVGLQPAAPPAALYKHVVRPRMVVVAILTDVLQRLNVALSSMSVVGRIAMWFTCSDDILLPDTLIYTRLYLFCIALMCLHISYVTAYILLL